jgi:MoaA/NifB/PqqE/SkfB family radical SAM enzyme
VTKLLTIETGFSCNSRCHYCTQLDYRALPQEAELDLSGDTIRQRIDWAAQNEYDEIGFSGGEPTIRPDFLDLIRYAKQRGFRHIGVTTNGRMLAYRRFAEAMLRAGVDGLTFSLHGPTPALHDRLAAAPGALEQALTGLRHVGELAEMLGIRLRLMNNQILLRENVEHIGAMVELLAPLGVRLFMVQPFIAQRSNVDDLGRFFVPYADVVEGVRAALPALQRYGARIKPYNVPNCVLWPLGREQIESQQYDITVYREFEQESAGEFKAFRAKQWYRIDACRDCHEKCPGFRIEQYPQELMQQAIIEAARTFASQHPDRTGPLLFSGTELLTPESLAQLFQVLSSEFGPVAWLTGAAERSTRAELARVVLRAHAAGHLAEVAVVGQPMDQRFLAQRVIEKGNLEEIRNFFAELKGQRQGQQPLPKLRLLLNTSDTSRLLGDPSVAGHLPQLSQELCDLSGDFAADLLITLPNFPRDRPPPDIARQSQELLELAAQFRDAGRALHLKVVVGTLGDARGVDALRGQAIQLAEALFAQVLPSEPLDERLFRHAFSNAELDFVSWSPPWLFERWDLRSQTMPIAAQGLDRRDREPHSETAVVRPTGEAKPTPGKRFAGKSIKG